MCIHIQLRGFASTSNCLTMETEQVFILLWSRGDLDDRDGEAVGGRREDS